jgi:hypothetical protein
MDYGPRIGADPEIFVHNPDKKVIPICGLVGGTKEYPTIITDMVKSLYGYSPEGVRSGGAIVKDGSSLADIGDFAVQEDNVMLEFNIPASPSVVGFRDNISIALNTIKTMYLSDKKVDYRFNRVTTKFSSTTLASHGRQALEIGCEPDYDAYSNPAVGFKRAPFCAMDLGPFRFCGGHLHVQYNKNNCEPHIFAQLMDCVIGVPSIFHDIQGRRRRFYGQPGLYREKPYGIEYRTLSNFWLTPHTRDTWLPAALNGVFWLAESINTQPDILKEAYSKIDFDMVREAISSENMPMARKTINQLIASGIYFSSGSIG